MELVLPARHAHLFEGTAAQAAEMHIRRQHQA